MELLDGQQKRFGPNVNKSALKSSTQDVTEILWMRNRT